MTLNRSTLFVSIMLASTAANALVPDGRDLKAGDTAIAVGQPTVACEGAEFGRLMAIRDKALDKDSSDMGVEQAERDVARQSNWKACTLFKAGTKLYVAEAHNGHVCVRLRANGTGCRYTHFGRVDPIEAHR